MSKTTERLVAVTNELEDIVAHFEEKERPDAGWINEHWIEALTNIRNEGLDIWGFEMDSNPTEVVHEVYMAYKDACDRIDELQNRIDHLRADEVNQQRPPEAPTVQPEFHGRLDWRNVGMAQAQQLPEEVWNLDQLTIRGPDVT